MIKVYDGAKELPYDYYFNYSDSSQAYDKTARVIKSKLVIEDYKETNPVDFMTYWSGRPDITVIESKQVGYMMNIFNISNFSYSEQMDSGNVIYEMELIRRMTPKQINSVTFKDITQGTLADLEATYAMVVSVDDIQVNGYTYFTDNKYVLLSNVKKTEYPNEVGRCRVVSGTSFYVTIGGGANVRFIQGHGGIPFPNKIRVGHESDQKNQFTGRVMLVD